MFSDGLIELIELGVITGKKKTLWPNKIVATFAEGTKRFMILSMRILYSSLCRLIMLTILA